MQFFGEAQHNRNSIHLQIPLSRDIITLQILFFARRSRDGLFLSVPFKALFAPHAPFNGFLMPARYAHIMAYKPQIPLFEIGFVLFTMGGGVSPRKGSMLFGLAFPQTFLAIPRICPP